MGLVFAGYNPDGSNKYVDSDFIDSVRQQYLANTSGGAGATLAPAIGNGNIVDSMRADIQRQMLDKRAAVNGTASTAPTGGGQPTGVLRTEDGLDQAYQPMTGSGVNSGSIVYRRTGLPPENVTGPSDFIANARADATAKARANNAVGPSGHAPAGDPEVDPNFLGTPRYGLQDGAGDFVGRVRSGYTAPINPDNGAEDLNIVENPIVSDYRKKAREAALANVEDPHGYRFQTRGSGDGTLDPNKTLDAVKAEHRAVNAKYAAAIKLAAGDKDKIKAADDEKATDMARIDAAYSAIPIEKRVADRTRSFISGITDGLSGLAGAAGAPSTVPNPAAPADNYIEVTVAGGGKAKLTNAEVEKYKTATPAQRKTIIEDAKGR